MTPDRGAVTLVAEAIRLAAVLGVTCAYDVAVLAGCEQSAAARACRYAAEQGRLEPAGWLPVRGAQAMRLWRIRRRTPLSPEAAAARRPPPPEMLVEVDSETKPITGRARAAKTGRG